MVGNLVTSPLTAPDERRLVWMGLKSRPRIGPVCVLFRKMRASLWCKRWWLALLRDRPKLFHSSTKSEIRCCIRALKSKIAAR